MATCAVSNCDDEPIFEHYDLNEYDPDEELCFEHRRRNIRSQRMRNKDGNKFASIDSAGQGVGYGFENDSAGTFILE